MAELGGASILGADRKVCPYRLRDPIAVAHAPEVFFDGSGDNVVPALVRLALKGFAGAPIHSALSMASRN